MADAVCDGAFVIADVRSVRVRAPGADYWNGFITDARTAAAPSRFIFSPPWRTAYAREVESALLRVRLADGTVGWGEATCPVGPEAVCVLANGIVAEIVRDRAFASVEDLVDVLYDAQRCRGYLAGHYQDAVAALDMALHDAIAKRAGLPVHALVGARTADVLPCYLSGARAPTRAERISLLQQWAASGSGAVKIFLKGALASDLDEFAALRAAVPQLDWWAADALWTLDAADVAREAKAALGRLGARWLECPMLPENFDGHASLRSQPGAPIALGEHFRTDLQAAPWLAAPALDILQPDIGRTGFVMAARMRRAAAVSPKPVAVTPHMGGALDIMQAATLQFAATCDTALPCEYQAGLARRLPGVIRTEWARESGGFRVPDVPGLGVAVDETALQAFIVPTE